MADRQATSRSSQFLDACRQYNLKEISHEDLIERTVRLGFNNVIDAFHVVHQGEIEERFFVDERRSEHRGIQITDSLIKLAKNVQYQNLPSEVEARWRLVETAWELNLPNHVLTVDYDSESELLITNERSVARRSITGCREALNGYQKGKCFYCFDDISVDATSENLADVDHFFPHLLKPFGLNDRIDGVWNLVLACQKCNRGTNGKSARLPELRFLERLHNRNSFFIESHHPLRETLMMQTGSEERHRRQFLQSTYRMSKEYLIHNWKPEFEYEPAF